MSMSVFKRLIKISLSEKYKCTLFQEFTILQELIAYTFSASSSKDHSKEGDIGVCSIAVLDNFSCGISVILILNCSIAVFCKSAGCGLLAFWMG